MKKKNPTMPRKVGYATRPAAEAALADAFVTVSHLVENPASRTTFIKLSRVLRALAPFRPRA